MHIFKKQGLVSAICLLITGMFLHSCTGNTAVNNPERENYNHMRAPGQSAGDFLTDTPYSSVIVEVDYVEGFAPTISARNSLEAFLEERLNKPGGVAIMLDDKIPVTGNQAMTAGDIRDLESQYRNQFSVDDRLAAYLIILDGKFEQESVLGLAYYNTSMALFEEVIRDNTGGLGQPSAATVEATVMRHEAGHLMGLVDNGTPAQTDHVDEERGAHCTTESCLMYYSVRDAGFIGNLSGGNIPSLGEFCLQDLKANGGS